MQIEICNHCNQTCSPTQILEVFEMKSWHSVSLPAWLKDLDVEVILISGFVNSEIRIRSENCGKFFPANRRHHNW